MGSVELTHGLSPAACRHDGELRAFVVGRISANAWPIQSPVLLKRLRRTGLDLAAVRDFRTSVPDLTSLMRRIVAHSLRAERLLGIDNAYHHTHHNLDVLLRLLLLEWPVGCPIPSRIRSAAARACTSLDDVEPVLVDLMGRLLELGFPDWKLARDVLAAVGHDYGHGGGADRLDAAGRPLPLTHEEAAERHVAKFGIWLGLPPALILESLAGIRATTFHIRPGRPPIAAANDFERKLTLADTAGWVLAPDQWLVHVAIALVAETIAHQRRARVGNLNEFFDSELGFLHFCRDHRLAPVPAGEQLWGETVERRIALIERVLARETLLAPLAECGFALLEEIVGQLTAAGSLASWLAGPGVDPRLREIFSDFLAAD